MCGDLDEDGKHEDELYARFLVQARALMGRSAEARPPAPPDDLHASMDRLFADALSRCLRDMQAADEAGRYRLLSAQPLVFARLAGFLAGHVGLREDPLRKVIEALMYGYAEAERIEPGHGHDHHHDGGPGQPHHHGRDHAH